MSGSQAEHKRVNIQKRLLCLPRTTEPNQAGGPGHLRSCALEQTGSPTRETLPLISPGWEGSKSDQRWRVGRGAGEEGGGVQRPLLPDNH